MKINNIKQLGDDKYILLDAGEVWDLEISLIGRSAIYLKPKECELQLGAKQYVESLIDLHIKNLEIKKDINYNKDATINGGIEALKKLKKSLKW